MQRICDVGSKVAAAMIWRTRGDRRTRSAGIEQKVAGSEFTEFPRCLDSSSDEALGLGASVAPRESGPSPEEADRRDSQCQGHRHRELESKATGGNGRNACLEEQSTERDPAHE
jgi:hypothetical protein